MNIVVRAFADAAVIAGFIGLSGWAWHNLATAPPQENWAPHLIEAPKQGWTKTAAAEPSNREIMQATGEFLKAAHGITDYDISFLGGEFDVTVPTFSTDAAGTLASAICTTLRNKLDGRVEVKVFLPVGGSRPAASCRAH